MNLQVRVYIKAGLRWYHAEIGPISDPTNEWLHSHHNTRNITICSPIILHTIIRFGTALLHWLCDCSQSMFRSLAVEIHDDVMYWKHLPRYWPFVRGIHRWPVDSPHKDQWCGTLMFPLICAWATGWANNRDAADLRRNGANCDFTVIYSIKVTHNKLLRQ